MISSTMTRCRRSEMTMNDGEQSRPGPAMLTRGRMRCRVGQQRVRRRGDEMKIPSRIQEGQEAEGRRRRRRMTRVTSDSVRKIESSQVSTLISRVEPGPQLRRPGPELVQATRLGAGDGACGTCRYLDPSPSPALLHDGPPLLSVFLHLHPSDQRRCSSRVGAGTETSFLDRASHVAPPDAATAMVSSGLPQVEVL